MKVRRCVLLSSRQQYTVLSVFQVARPVQVTCDKWLCLLLCLDFLAVYHKMGLASALASVVASALILFWFVKNDILIFLGKISYSIYLIHIPVGTRVVNVLSVTPFFRDHGHLVILLALIVTLVAAYGFYRMIERPSIRLSQKIVYKRAP